MGNIRTSFVKRLARELIETHKGVFTTDFEENKKRHATIFRLSRVVNSFIRLSFVAFRLFSSYVTIPRNIKSAKPVDICKSLYLLL